MSIKLNSNKMNVIIGIITNHQQEVFIAERPLNKYKAGLWEFPGGKVEQNESLFQALQRELKEEIDINVLSAEPWLITEYDYGDRIVLLNTWRVTQFSGIPHGKEGQKIAWVAKNILNQFKFPEGNQKILENLIANK